MYSNVCTAALSALFLSVVPTGTGRPLAATQRAWEDYSCALIVEDDFESHKHHQSLFCRSTLHAAVTVMIPINANENEVSPYIADVHPEHAVALSLTGTSRLFKAQDGTTIDLDTGATLVAASTERKARVRRGDDRSLSVGERSVLVLRVEYNGAIPEYCDEACARNNLREIDNAFDQMSYGRLRFPEEKSAVHTVQITDGEHDQRGCDHYSIAIEANEAAEQAGIDVGNYQHTLYMIPRSFGTSSCRFGGLAFMGCTKPYCMSWIRNEHAASMAHELAHNINAKHSSTDKDNNGIEDDEYGDNSDLMGFQKFWRGMNAPHRVLLGWMPEDGIKDLAPAPACANPATSHVSLRSLSDTTLPTSAVSSVVRIPRSATCNTDDAKEREAGQYYVSFRAATGLDKSFVDPANAKRAEYADKVYVHYTYSSLDVQNTELVQILSVGDVFNDAHSNVAVTFAANHANEAAVVIDFCGGATTTTTSTTTTAPTPQLVQDAGENSDSANCDGRSLSHFTAPVADKRIQGSKSLIGSPVAPDMEGCAQACLEQDGDSCVAFAFTQTTSICRVYSAGSNTLMSVDSSKRMVFLERHANCVGVAVQVAAPVAKCGLDGLSHFDDVVADQKGKFVYKHKGKKVHPKSSPEKCAALCVEAGNSCRAFAVDAKSRCRLYKFTATKTVKPKQGFSFYVKSAECVDGPAN